MNTETINNKNLNKYSELLPAAEADAENRILLGVDEDGKGIAAAEFDLTEGICSLISIYTAEDSRRKGAGSLILSSVEDMLKNRDCPGIRCAFPDDEGLKAFFASAGYVITADKPVFDIPVDRVLDSDAAQRSATGDRGHTVPLGQLTARLRTKLTQFIKESGYDPVSIWRFGYDMELSRVYIKNDEISGCLLAGTEGDIVFIYLLLTNRNAVGLTMMELLYSFINRLSAVRDKYTKIRFYAEDEQITDFIRHTLGDLNCLAESNEICVAAKALTVVIGSQEIFL